MPKVIVVWNLRPGSGKTTISINLACQLAQTASVCLVDGDTSASAIRWVDEGHLPVSVKWLPLMYKVMPSFRLPDVENYRSLILAWYEQAKATEHTALQPAVFSDEFVTEVEAWKQHVAAISADLVVIDLPSGSQMISSAAVTIADLIVVPAVEFYGIVENPATWLQKDLGDRAPKLAPVLHVISNPFQARKHKRKVESALLKLGELVGPAISYQTTFQAIAQERAWVGSFAPQSVAHKQVVALASKVQDVLAKRSLESDRSVGKGNDEPASARDWRVAVEH